MLTFKVSGRDQLKVKFSEILINRSSDKRDKSYPASASLVSILNFKFNIFFNSSCSAGEGDRQLLEDDLRRRFLRKDSGLSRGLPERLRRSQVILNNK